MSVLLCFSSCAQPKGDPLGYRSGGFSATVTVQTEKACFDAIFHISPPDESGILSFKVDFLSPESLKGLSVFQGESGFEISLNGKPFLTHDASTLSSLDIGSAVRALSPCDPIISVKSADGYTVVTTKDSTVYIDPSDSLPVKAISEARGITVTVKEFVFS